MNIKHNSLLSSSFVYVHNNIHIVVITNSILIPIPSVGIVESELILPLRCLIKSLTLEVRRRGGGGGGVILLASCKIDLLTVRQLAVVVVVLGCCCCCCC